MGAPRTVIPGVERVLISDQGVDACLVQQPGGGAVLVVRPHQTVGSAVRAIQAVVPHAQLDDVRALVRAHLPADMPDLDDVFRPTAANRFEPVLPVALRLRVVWAVASLATMLMVAGFYALHANGKVEYRNSADEAAQPIVQGYLISADHPSEVAPIRAAAVTAKVAYPPETTVAPTPVREAAPQETRPALASEVVGQNGGSSAPADEAQGSDAGEPADDVAHGSLLPPALAELVDPLLDPQPPPSPLERDAR